MKNTVHFLTAFLLAASLATAAPLSRENVPEPLKPWIDWVLHDVQEKNCPILFDNGDQSICAWPSFLDLAVLQSTAVFKVKWRVFAADLWLPLPGNAGLWPQEVMVNGEIRPVSDRDGRPAVYVDSPGEYNINGVFSFDRPPDWFPVPEQTGLIRLSVCGNPIDFPRLDREGRLWLRTEGPPGPDMENRENRLQVLVHRLIEDDVPVRIITRLELSVSGKHREVRLGRAVGEAFIPMRLSSDLPARIDGQGDLLVQARPGRWLVEVVVRHREPVSELTLAAVGGFGLDEELWAFAARNQLRMVTVEGPTQVDPMQTTIPAEWRHFPVYLMTPAAVMKFAEKKRGDPLPAPDQLQLERIFWLHFDGRGYSVRDRITGTMTTGWRLEMNPPQLLGRVTVNGQEQLITRLEETGKDGVEMRYGNVDLAAESRITVIDRIPVTGWDRDFQSVKGALNLPPGWSLFHAAGVDNISRTWLRAWDWMDMFLVLIIAVAATRLCGWKWGLVALATLALLNHEAGAPRWVWLHLLAAMALLRVLPKGSIHRLVHYYWMSTIMALVVVSLPFMVTQIKYGVYPQLEQSWRVLGADGEGAGPAEAMGGRSRRLVKEAPSDAVLMADQAVPARAEAYLSKSPLPQVSMVDTSARIQTGPGIPNWQWRQVTFSWNGPVGSGETLRFVFLSPVVNLVLAAVRVVLLVVMIFGLTGVRYRKKTGLDFSTFRPAAMAAGLMIGCLLAGTGAAAADGFPSEALLKELKAKLTDRDPPACLPACAVSPHMLLDMDAEALRLRMTIHALSDNVAVPLPGSDQQWLPETVRVDNRSANALFRSSTSGILWLNLRAGVHQVEIRGKLPPRRTVQLQLPLTPHHIEMRAEGWMVAGLHENGVPDGQLQFTRLEGEESEAADSFEEADEPVFPPLLEVTRTLSLGLTWQVDTRIRRLTPAGGAVVAAVPLLVGESVTSEVPVENGRVLVNLAPDQIHYGWTSSLEMTDRFVLKAAESTDWVEVWNVNIGQVWHAGIEGIPVIHHQDRSGSWLPEWRPWPGEEVAFSLTRPEGVAGQTHTIENSRLVVKPGRRIIHTELALNIRSSRGSRQVVVLPDEAVLQTVAINGQSQPIRQAGRNVTLPLTPGKQNIHLTWRENRPLGWNWRTPPVDLGLSSVDAFITVHMPRNRWVLLCGGPPVGPAVLFWSAVLVVVLLSAGLGRVQATPLRFRHWLLLGLGLTQSSLLIALPVAAWFLLMAYRGQTGNRLPTTAFNGLQVLLVVLTAAALSALLHGIKQGLLGYPDMQIAGNGSGNYLLNWYQDIAGKLLPRARVISLPLLVYRLLSLAWALWLAFAVVRWLPWAWQCFSADGLWRPLNLRQRLRKKSVSASPHGGQEEDQKAAHFDQDQGQHE